MKRPTLPLNQRGATLIEAVIAIAILTIGILTVMVMQVSAINHSSSAMNRSEANGVAMALLETLKEIPFDDANLDATSATLDELEAVAARARAWAERGDVFSYFISGAKVRNPAAAEALIAKLA